MGDTARLGHLLASGADIEAYDDQGLTPLMVACTSSKAGLGTVEFLIDHGADVNGTAKPFEIPEFKPMESRAGLAFTSALQDIQTVWDKASEALAAFRLEPPEILPVLLQVASQTSLEKIRLLVARGADLHYRTAAGRTALACAICPAVPIEVIDFLLDAGVPLAGASHRAKSALLEASQAARFDIVGRLLGRGMDPSELKWTPLMRAAAMGSIEDVRDVIATRPDLEAKDVWERTALLISIEAADMNKIDLLIGAGCNRSAGGRCGKTPLQIAVEKDDVVLLARLLAHGFDLERTDDFGKTALLDASETGTVPCFRLLVSAGANLLHASEGNTVVNVAANMAILKALREIGMDISMAQPEVLRDFIGLGNCDELPVSAVEYQAGRSRLFGTANPERMEIPFWNAMVRCGWNGYRATSQFDDSSFGRRDPVWCHQRFGMSLTILPDGRFVQIAGEHEDYYDPDFCIYNDVIVHDGNGNFEIYGYPEELFPPTDFHSATLVGEWIYIIGRLGYHAPGGINTPVFRLHTGTWKIERIATTGESPGWIWDHKATLQDDRIFIAGGKNVHRTEAGKSETQPNPQSYTLDLKNHAWQRFGA